LCVEFEYTQGQHYSIGFITSEPDAEVQSKSFQGGLCFCAGHAESHIRLSADGAKKTK
jgi:hypothetical protein